MSKRMTGAEKAGLALGAGLIGFFAWKDNAEAATVGGPGYPQQQLPESGPIIVPELNLPQSAVNWYDQALTNLGFAGTFSQRLMGFQTTRMQGVLAPELSHLTPATQQAIQNAVGISSTGDLGAQSFGGARRMRY